MAKPLTDMTKDELIHELKALREDRLKSLKDSREIESWATQIDAQNSEMAQVRQQFHQTRNRYLELFDLAPVAYAVLDSSGAIEEMNVAAATLLKLHRTHDRRCPFQKLVTPPDRQRFGEFLTQSLATQQEQQIEVTVDLSGGDSLPVQLIMQPRSASDQRASLWTAILDLRERRANEQETLENHAQVKQLNQELTQRTREAEQRALQVRHMAAELSDVEQRERRRLAQLLHDHVQQLLVAARMQTINGRDSAPEHLARVFDEIDDLLKQSITASKSLATEISPPIFYDGTLLEALEWVARWTEAKHGLHVHLDIRASIATLPDRLRLLLLHAVRELLLNVVKHSGVKAARIEVSNPNEHQLEVEVSDAGQGLPEELAPFSGESTGFGLMSIRERLRALGGEFRIGNCEAGGACIRLSVPLVPVTRNDAAPSRSGSDRLLPAAAPVKRNRLLVVDDHRLVRKGIVMLLQNEPDLEIAGEAGDGEQAIAEVRRLRPDIVLMDINMPHRDGISATQQIKQEFPETRVIGLSLHDNPSRAAAMYAAGASSYVTKDGEPETLREAIRVVIASD